MQQTQRQNENLEQRLLELQLQLLDDNYEDATVFTNVQPVDNDQNNTSPNKLPNKQTRSTSMPNNDNITPLPQKVEIIIGILIIIKNLSTAFMLVRCNH